jgi:hypothetical protein
MADATRSARFRVVDLRKLHTHKVEANSASYHSLDGKWVPTQTGKQTASPAIHQPRIHSMGFILCRLSATEKGDERPNWCRCKNGTVHFAFSHYVTHFGRQKAKVKVAPFSIATLAALLSSCRFTMSRQQIWKAKKATKQWNWQIFTRVVWRRRRKIGDFDLCVRNFYNSETVDDLMQMKSYVRLSSAATN